MNQRTSELKYHIPPTTLLHATTFGSLGLFSREREADACNCHGFLDRRSMAFEHPVKQTAICMEKVGRA